MDANKHAAKFLKSGAALAMLCLLGGCSDLPAFLASSGPSAAAVSLDHGSRPPISVVDVNDAVARRVEAAQRRVSFAEMFPDELTPDYVVGPGDVLEVTVWEAPPATLFGMHDPNSGVTVTPMTVLPVQMVASDGTINVPFAGAVPAAGLSPQQIEKQIVKHLRGKANQPQVMVQVAHNVTSNVTLVGEVGQSTRMPLTAKRERLMDALAAAGGVRPPVDKVTIQLARDGKVASMPMVAIVRDPRQNIPLRAGDVVTAQLAPYSFTALGATGKNAEVNFEATGITLAQALGRIGGLDDSRANPQGVFIFRFEEPAAFDAGGKPLYLTPEGRTPVVYRIDLKDAGSFLAAQDFPIRDRDVVYVANAPAAQFQKFINILYSSVFSVSYIKTL